LSYGKITIVLELIRTFPGVFWGNDAVCCDLEHILLLFNIKLKGLPMWSGLLTHTHTHTHTDTHLQTYIFLNQRFFCISTYLFVPLYILFWFCHSIKTCKLIVLMELPNRRYKEERQERCWCTVTLATRKYLVFFLSEYNSTRPHESPFHVMSGVETPSNERHVFNSLLFAHTRYNKDAT